ncbi:MAG: hypothetical protein QG608_210 [Actinomycetota bacterium]|nr:hypothetical protein [Actinomycetota bacterium]
MSTTIPHQVDDRAKAVCPGLRTDAVLHHSAKTVLLAGALDDVPVVAKVLVTTDPFWRARFAAEIATYRAFAVTPPPVPAPRLLAADPDAGVLVTTRLPGDPVATVRYPTHLDDTGAAPLLQAARDLGHWSAPEGMFPTVWDYPHRFHRYRTVYGLLDTADEAALTALVGIAAPNRPAHGDLLPANVLHQAGGVTAVLDWEFTGLFLPGMDAALLWILLGHLPAARRDAEHLAGNDLPHQAGFWVNTATVCVRELRTHRDLPDGPLRASRLAYLQATWDIVQARVHDLARRL